MDLGSSENQAWNNIQSHLSLINRRFHAQMNSRLYFDGRSAIVC